MGMTDEQKRAIHEAEDRLAEVRGILDAVLGLYPLLEGEHQRPKALDVSEEIEQTQLLLGYAQEMKTEYRDHVERAAAKVQQALDAAHADMSPQEKEDYAGKYGAEMRVVTDG